MPARPTGPGRRLGRVWPVREMAMAFGRQAGGKLEKSDTGPDDIRV